MSHLLRHGTPIYKIPSVRPVILTSKCRAPGEGRITTYSNVLGLTQPVRAGLELTTFRSQGGSSTTEPQRVRPKSKLGMRDYPSSRPVWKRQSNKLYETNHSAYVPVIICNRKQGHYNDCRICEMILNDINYNLATSAYL